MNYYHPTTLEHIRNPLPAVAEWATATAITAPYYDSASQQCRFIDGAWAVTSEDMAAQEADRIAEIIKEIEVIEKKKLRSMSDIVGGNPYKTDVTGKTSKEYFDEYEVQLETLRAELVAL